MALSVSPKGRLLQGNPFVASTTDYDGKPLTKADGTPTQEFFICVGFEKGVPENEAYIASLGADCVRFWPGQFPNGVGPAPSFGAVHPRFSSKVIDGDGLDGKGFPNAQKDGFTGHWCVRYASAYAPSVYEAGKYDPMQNLALDPSKHSLLRTGYFVRVASTHDTNGSDKTPGIKVYPSMVEILHAGPEIIKGPDAGAVFGGAPAARAATPPAASAAPTPPTPPAAPAAPAGLTSTGKDGQTIEGLRAAGWSDDQMVQGGYATRPVAPPAAPQPPALPSPPTPPAPPAPPYSGYMQADPDGPPAGFKVLPAAQGATYKSMIDGGWTHELLVLHGMVGPL